MDQEKERRISETGQPIQASISDAHTAILEDINKKVATSKIYCV